MSDRIQWRPNSFDTESVGLSMLTITGWCNEVNLACELSKWVQDRCDEGWNHASVRVLTGDTSTLVALEDAGFRCVDSLVTLAFEAKPTWKRDPRIELATPRDYAAIQAISSGAFKQTRYACDPWMPDGAADRVVQAWVSNNLNGRADRTWVVRVDGTAVGYLSSLWHPMNSLAVIDLIAVEPRCRGMGLGRLLIQSMISHYFGSADQITVGTQASNISALALYQSCGFHVTRFELGFARQLYPRRPGLRAGDANNS